MTVIRRNIASYTTKADLVPQVFRGQRQALKNYHSPFFTGHQATGMAWDVSLV